MNTLEMHSQETKLLKRIAFYRKYACFTKMRRLIRELERLQARF